MAKASLPHQCHLAAPRRVPVVLGQGGGRQEPVDGLNQSAESVVPALSLV